MFGTLAPKCEDRCSQGRYQENFCGCCHAMAELGRPWALATGYDIAFLHAVVVALENAEVEKRPCTALPFHELPVRRISQANRQWLVAFYLLLMSEKCKDDIADEGSWSGKLGLRVLRPKEEDAKQNLQRSGFPLTLLLELTSKQSLLEQNSGLDLESYARPIAHLMGEAFAHAALLTKQETQAGKLRHLGQALGYLIYLKDAQEDLQNDRKQGRFNAVLSSNNGEQVQRIRRREFKRLMHGLDGLCVSDADRQMLLSVLKELNPQEPGKDITQRPLLTRMRDRSQRGICEVFLCCGPELCGCGASAGEICCTACGGCPCDCCLLAASNDKSSAAETAKSPPPPLHCPACGNNLLAQIHDGIEIDECRTCNGLWLDKGELEQLAETTYPLPKRLLEPKAPTKLQLRPEGCRPCPRCGHFLVGTIVKGVRLDICSDCQGLWLDQGELNQLLT